MRWVTYQNRWPNADALPYFIGVHLPHWSIARRCRREWRDWARWPVVVVAVVPRRGAGWFVVDAADPAAEAGVRPGMSLAEATALCPGLVRLDHDPIGDDRTRVALGRWMNRFSPTVATRWADPSLDELEFPPFLLLDVTGCERLFGDVLSIVDRAAGALQRLRIPARLAAAPTPAAANAIARGSPHSNPVVDSAGLVAAVSPLPVELVRLADKTVQDLHALGIRRIGQLLELPRSQLPLRFGAELVVRLEQLLGERPEPLVGLPYETPVTAAMAFEYAVENPANLLLAVEHLCREVCRDLLRRGRGARQADMEFSPDPADRRPVVIRSVRFARPVRDPVRMSKLLACKLEQIDCEGGFVAVRLTVPAHDSIAMSQSPLTAVDLGRDGADSAGEWDRLVERLVVRLGESAVVRPVPVESYLPERAWRLTNAIDAPDPVGTDGNRANVSRADGGRADGGRADGGRADGGRADDGRADDGRADDGRADDGRADGGRADPPTVGREGVSLNASPVGVRPFRLLPTPVEIRVVAEPSDGWDSRPIQFTHGSEVCRLVQVTGPERLSGEWWRGHNKTRDYYDVQTRHGQRFWLFRVASGTLDRPTVRWFLHGLFQ